MRLGLVESVIRPAASRAQGGDGLGWQARGVDVRFVHGVYLRFQIGH